MKQNESMGIVDQIYAATKEWADELSREGRVFQSGLDEVNINMPMMDAIYNAMKNHQNDPIFYDTENAFGFVDISDFVQEYACLKEIGPAFDVCNNGRSPDDRHNAASACLEELRYVKDQLCSAFDYCMPERNYTKEPLTDQEVLFFINYGNEIDHTLMTQGPQAAKNKFQTLYDEKRHAVDIYIKNNARNTLDALKQKTNEANKTVNKANIGINKFEHPKQPTQATKQEQLNELHIKNSERTDANSR